MDFPIEMQRKYTRIPFKSHGRDFRGCDCGGLVWLVYKNELGIELPDWREIYSGTQVEDSLELEEAVSTMLGENGIEVELKDVRPFDVISFRVCGQASTHVGLAISNSKFIHIMQGLSNVETERFDSIKWQRRITGCFRHAAMFEK